MKLLLFSHFLKNKAARRAASCIHCGT